MRVPEAAQNRGKWRVSGGFLMRVVFYEMLLFLPYFYGKMGYKWGTVKKVWGTAVVELLM